MSRTKSAHWGWMLGIAMGSVSALGGNSAHAQISPDTTLPNNTVVTPDGNTFNITAGTQAGSNLFHSFREFSIPTGSAAIFNNTIDIQNIISRVTGGSISNIDGLIQTLGSANLFLINPNGIVFGANARLNVGGSFVGSTAESLIFADGTQFSATPQQTSPLLTISVPTGLQMGQNPGSIRTQSQLQVNPGNTLALLGSDVTLDGGSLQALNGRVELAGVSDSGIVDVSINNTISLNVPQNVPRGDVTLTHRAKVDVTDTGNGSIAINARNIDILEGSRLLAGIKSGLTAIGEPQNITLNATGALRVSLENNSALVATSFVNGNSGDIRLTSSFGSVSVSNSLISTNIAAIESDRIFGEGKGGDIFISGKSVFITGGSELTARTSLGGSSGNIEVNAQDTLEISGRVPELFSNKNRSQTALYSTLLTSTEKDAKSSAGNISISVTNGILRLADGGNLRAESQGNFTGGNITVNARYVELTGGGKILASASQSGDAGNITINSENLTISGNNPNFDDIFNQAVEKYDSSRQAEIRLGTVRSGDSEVYANTSVSGNSTGRAGNVNITTGKLTVQDGAQVSVSSGRSNAGELNISARSIVLDNSGELRAATASRVGGSITLNIQNYISMRRQSLTNQQVIMQMAVISLSIALLLKEEVMNLPLLGAVDYRQILMSQ